ncbi:MAG: Rieske 2Fe-2S domain-containing protein [Chloroflexota bacterium]
MLSAADNELLCRVGPGTPMGGYLRRFWTPFLESWRLEAGGSPEDVRLLGEDLVAWRDPSGKVGLMEARCPHRRAPMFYGRNEENGLRCVYHGWQFDHLGNCLEMPAEPAGSTFKDKLKAVAYPVEERGGVLWAYMGPRHLQPSFPEFEWTRVREDQRITSRYRHECSWFQSLEGDVDSSHISYLHWDARYQKANKDVDLWVFDRAPRWTLQPTDYGMMLAARRNTPEEGRYYWRINHFLQPFYTMVATSLDLKRLLVHIWVPIDDETSEVWDILYATDEAIEQPERDRWLGGDTPHIASLDRATARITADRSKRYGIDREAQRTWSYTGIAGIRNQDLVMVEGMGAIVDRTTEHLGTSDAAVIALRRLFQGYVRDFQEGIEPPAASEPELFNIRSWSALLPTEEHIDRDPEAQRLQGPRVK